MSGQVAFQPTTSAAGLVYVSGVVPQAAALDGDVAVLVGAVLRQIDERLTAQESSLGRAVSLQVQQRAARP